MFKLPDLPYAKNALEPVMSEIQLTIHHDKHHAKYVETLNKFLADAGEKPESIEAVVKATAGDAAKKKWFNNSAQAWNHAFFWVAMTPKFEKPQGDLASAIDKTFGGLDALKKAFVTEGAGHFGSGWVWLTANHNGELKVISTHDADDTLTHGDLTPLMVCDVWEHAYYVDYQNDRKTFLEAWFDALPHWEFAGFQLKAATGHGDPWRFPAPEAANTLKTA